MGWSGDRILRLFRSPFYRGAHHILRVKGEEFVRQLIESVDSVYRQVRSPDGGGP